MPTKKRSPSQTGVVVALPTRVGKRLTPREIAFNAEFGRRLEQARIERGITQRALADALGVGYHAYKKYEYGSREFPLYLLRDASTILDKTISWLLTGRG